MRDPIHPLRCILVFGAMLPAAGAQLAAVTPLDRVTLPQVHMGDLVTDSRLLDSYGRPPEARRDFYLNAREILAGNPAATPAEPRVVEAAVAAGLPLMSGPMLGDVSASGVTVWFRPVHAGGLVVKVAADGEDQGKEFRVEAKQAGAVTRVRLEGLMAGTRHTYRIMNEAGDDLGVGVFRTVPGEGSKEPLRIAFGSCFHKIGVHNPNLMRQVAERGNHAMLLLGDLAVDDREAKLNLHHADYLLRDVSEPWRKFSREIPVYASWDDHDYLNNDKSGLQKGQIGEAERDALRLLWQENWNNPPAAVEGRGIYFNTVIGEVEIIMLDTRSCRERDKRGEEGSYLGEAQMRWLLETLKASKARFILITSGTMWSDFVSKGKDSWGAWDIPARERIFNCIEQNGIGGVFLLSGDRHGARGFRIERPSGFTLHEFEAATLGGVPGPPAHAPDRAAQIFGYGGGQIAFGEFTFETGKPAPEVTFRLIDEQGRELEKHAFTRFALLPGAEKRK